MEGVAGRATGQFPLSIATSLAIESACGIHPEIIAKKPPVRDFQELWINVKTLFRNLYGSLDKETAEIVSFHEMGQTLIQEMETIRSIIAEYSPSTKVVYFINEYLNIERDYPHAVIRSETTEKKRDYQNLLDQTIEQYLDKNKELGIVLSIGKLEPKSYVSAMIMTHMVLDLIARYKFDNLVLLESHTGKIKPFPQWYTKYFNGKDLPMIPFQIGLLQIFGDDVTFKPLSIKIRKEIAAVAEKRSWAAITSKDRIRSNLSTDLSPDTWEKIRDIV